MIRRLFDKFMGKQSSPPLLSQKDPSKEYDWDLGAVLEDGKQIWVKERGKDYKDFWTNVASSHKGACIVTRGAEVDFHDMNIQCISLAEKIYHSLSLDEKCTVLDVGCGMGAMGHYIAPKVKFYHGADISPSMLEHTKSNLKDFDNVTLHELQWCDLRSLQDSTYDAVFFESVLIHMAREDAYRYLEETYRVLKPGGRGYFLFFDLTAPLGIKEFKRMKDKFSDGKGNNIVSRSRFLAPQEVRLYCKEAGFKIDEKKSQINLPEDIGKIHDEEHVLVAICVKE